VDSAVPFGRGMCLLCCVDTPPRIVLLCYDKRFVAFLAAVCVSKRLLVCCRWKCQEVMTPLSSACGRVFIPSRGKKD
jgi:hypothetical protein